MAIQNVRESQAPLRNLYQIDPGAARVVDCARTISIDAHDPYHTRVEPMPGSDTRVPIGVHTAVGGPHDAPTPGDLLCAALAACLDSTIRMVSNVLGVALDSLEVTVTGDVDVRGTLVVNRDVPVGFQAMRCHVALRPRSGTDPALVARLEAAAEHSCVVLQTLRVPPGIETVFELQ